MCQRLISIGILTVIVVIFLGCQTNQSIEPSPGPDLNLDLVGCWELVEADSLFEGDLFITCDGMGIEYSIVGCWFQKRVFDFHDLDYEIADGVLNFAERCYIPKNRRLEESPCPYFPDEGLIKIFLINGNIPLTIKVGYDEERGQFVERRSIWTDAHKFEQDTIWIYVINDSVTAVGISPNFRFWCPVWFFEISNFRIPMTDWKRRIGDTTFAIGDLRFVEQIIYYNRYSFVNPQSGWLEYLLHNNLRSAYFARDVGIVLTEHSTIYENGDTIPRLQKVELIDYFNPLTTVEAKWALADYNHVQRHKRD